MWRSQAPPPIQCCIPTNAYYNYTVNKYDSTIRVRSCGCYTGAAATAREAAISVLISLSVVRWYFDLKVPCSNGNADEQFYIQNTRVTRVLSWSIPFK